MGVEPITFNKWYHKLFWGLFLLFADFVDAVRSTMGYESHRKLRLQLTKKELPEWLIRVEKVSDAPTDFHYKGLSLRHANKYRDDFEKQYKRTVKVVRHEKLHYVVG